MQPPRLSPRPPAEHDRFVQPLGEAAFLALIEARGGRRTYIPATPKPWLVKIVGEPAAAALCAALGGNQVKVPLCTAWRIGVYWARGETCGAIATQVCMSEDGVHRVIRAHREAAKAASRARMARGAR